MGALTINVKFTRTCRGLAQGNARLRNFNGIYVLTSYGKGAGSNSSKSKKCISWGNSLSGIKLTSII